MCRQVRYVLQELGGWASVEMVRRYAHFSAEHLADYAKNIENKVDRGAILVAKFFVDITMQ